MFAVCDFDEKDLNDDDEDKGRDDVALGDTLFKEDPFGEVSSEEDHCFAFCKEEGYPVDHIISKVEAFQGFFDELVVNAIKRLFKVD